MTFTSRTLVSINSSFFRKSKYGFVGERFVGEMEGGEKWMCKRLLIICSSSRGGR
jgi:hypothetical protein